MFVTTDYVTHSICIHIYTLLNVLHYLYYHVLMIKISRNHDICLHHTRMVPTARRIVQTAIVKKIGIFTS